MNKKEKIERIHQIMDEWGSTTSGELELESSPCINSIGNGKNNVSQLVEYFYRNYVTTITYHDEHELGENDIFYEDLSDDILDEILNILEEYDVSMTKLMNSTRDENF